MFTKIGCSKIVVSLIAVSLCFFSYVVGERNGRETGASQGYLKGQIDFALDIKSNINETIGVKSDAKSYYFFKNIKDMTLYVVVKNNVKTIAFWEDEK
ncbi:hypothetical protein ACN9MJ_07300 [Acidovorax facilis]|uniref:hypothetical protein n=1 Tax=Acidovorax facilis TaxID=12917 RepID=UPI003CF20353